MFEYLFKKIGINSNRTQNIINHIGASFYYKAGSVIANFLIVPLTIEYLDNERYGIWLTISSFIAWFSFFDIGLGNGLRNKFAEARAKGKNKLAQAYVSSAYYTISTISASVVVIFLVLNPFIDWSFILNTSSNLREELHILLPVVFAFFGMQLVVQLITTIYIADQHHSVKNKIRFISQSLSLLFIWGLTKTESSSLLLFGILYSSLPVLILFLFNIIAFKNAYKEFKPRLRLWKFKYLRDLTNLGFKFFVIQIAALILFATDNFIIIQLFSPEEVVPYNVSYKYFSIVTMVFTIIVTPYWSSFTEAYTNKDFTWIKSSVKNIRKIWLFIPLVLITLILFADWFYYIWVGDMVEVPFGLSIAMALYVLLLTFNMIYVNFINGVGKLKIQLITGIISMIINIPLSIVFGRYFEWGTTGVILATCFCLGYSVILRPIQYHKIINNRATGIWNE